MAAAGPGPRGEPRVAGDVTVHAHVVGIFYRGEGPEKEPLAREGDEVSEGQAIGTIEALGRLVAVKAPVDGTIDELVAEDGQRVEYGTLIARIRPAEGGA